MTMKDVATTTAKEIIELIDSEFKEQVGSSKPVVFVNNTLFKDKEKWTSVISKIIRKNYEDMFEPMR